eukprot:COSAG02_NODE_6117_length_3788_cov_77.670371_3_plen_100_part_00
MHSACDVMNQVMNLDPWNVNPEDPIGGFSAAPPKMTGIGTVMKSAGYTTAFAGKWDVGMATPAQTPRGRGYDQSLHYFHHENGPSRRAGLVCRISFWAG